MNNKFSEIEKKLNYVLSKDINIAEVIIFPYFPHTIVL